MFHTPYRIRKAVADNVEVVDVDGSYLHRKCKRIEESGMSTPTLNLPLSPPIHGWENLTEANAAELGQKIPYVSNGIVYTYLARQTCQDNGQSSFRALTQGFTHWKSCRVNTISINVCNPTNCHVKSVMQPSMKSGTYHVWLMLQRSEMGHVNVMRATCECAAAGFLSGGRGEHLPPLALACPPWEFCSDSESIILFILERSNCQHTMQVSMNSCHIMYEHIIGTFIN